MMKVFISQPMAGRSESEILKERERLIANIKEREPEAEIIDSYQRDYAFAVNNFTSPKDDKGALKYLAESLKMLADADIAVFPKGWQMFRGCVIEEQCARFYGITVWREM